MEKMIQELIIEKLMAKLIETRFKEKKGNCEIYIKKTDACSELIELIKEFN